MESWRTMGPCMNRCQAMPSAAPGQAWEPSQSVSAGLNETCSMKRAESGAVMRTPRWYTSGR